MDFYTSKLKGILILVIFSSLTTHLSSAQSTSKFNSYQIRFETGGIVSTNQVTPFWLRANKFGVVPLITPVATAQVYVARDYVRKDTLDRDTKSRHSNRFGWGFALNPVVNTGNTSQLLLSEGYIKVKYGVVELSGGRRHELIGLGDTLLTSGFMIGSGNALPIPKVQLATRGYVPLKFLNNFLALKAGFAHGWFLNTYIQNSFLHQKYFYWRFGKPESTLKIHAGINHQVQWGGRADYLIGSVVSVNGQLPSSFKYYGNIILANAPKDFDNKDYNSFDGGYRIGNHIGGHDLGIEVKTKRESMLLYYQHPFEDVSGLVFQNLPDGLFGFSWRRPDDHASPIGRVNHVVVEYLHTLDQTGPTFIRPGSSYQGVDNYFNHAQYREGWSYKGRSLGTPFIAPQSELRPEITPSTFFSDNRVQLYYAGVSGRFMKKLNWTTRLGYSLHYGIYNHPFSQVLNQFSFLLSAQTAISTSGKTRINTSYCLRSWTGIS